METKNSNIQGLGRLALTPTSSNTVGCTDSTASNFDSSALVDDGSCIAAVLGCTDATAVLPVGENYNANANVDDGSCVFYGCMDSIASNYNSNATNASANYLCTYDVYGCMDATLDSSGGNLMFNYNSLATQACNGSGANAQYNFGPPAYYSQVTVPCTGGQTGPNCCCVTTVYGCMDPLAGNYDPAANVQQVSFVDTTDPCFTAVLGCLDVNACNHTPGANTQGTGTYEQCAYCNEFGANNFDGYDPNDLNIPLAGCNIGCLACKIVANLQEVLGGSSNTEISWDETFLTTGAAQVDYYEIYYSDDNGVTYNTISNIQPNVNQSTIHYTFSGLLASTAYNIKVRAVCVSGTLAINPSHFTSSDFTSEIIVNTPALQIFGCTDFNACNYDSTATTDNGSCQMPAPNADCSGNCLLGYVNHLQLGCVLLTVGCTDATACNYDPAAIADDGSCILPDGCTDPLYLEYDATAQCDDGSCATLIVNGCTDEFTNTIPNFNYNPNANVDDGSCSSTLGDVVNLVSSPGFPEWIQISFTGAGQTINDISWDFNGTTVNPDFFEMQMVRVSGNNVQGDFTATFNFGSFPIPIAYTAIIPYTAGNINHTFTYFNGHLSSVAWYHYRVRYRKTINGVIHNGPFLDYWRQSQ